MEGRRVVIDVDHYPTALQVCPCAVTCICGSDVLYSVAKGLADAK